MLRHITWQIPSGQAIAQAIGAPVLGACNFPEWRGYGVGLDANTPLWYYVLKEAELLEQGLRLGPVGAPIVGEVFIGLLQLAPGVVPAGQPRLPAHAAEPRTRQLPHDRSADVRAGRPHQPRSVTVAPRAWPRPQ